MPQEGSSRDRTPPRRKDLNGQAEAPGGALQEPGSGKRPGGGGRQPPWDKGADAETGSFGAWLRRQREMREISLRDVAERTKISLRYLEAMEDDRFDLLPAPVFAKGFLREYARYVGLSPDEVVNHYLVTHKPEEEEEVERTMIGRQRRSWTYGAFLLLVALILLGLVGALAWYSERARARDGTGGAAPPIAAPPTVPAAVSPEPALPAEALPEHPGAPLELTLDFTQDCWVELVVDGKTRLSELRVQGESLQIPAQESVVLTLGNAAAVEAQVNGRPLPLPRGDKAVVRDLRIDLETVRTLREES